MSEQLEAEIRFNLLPVSRALNRYERLLVISRIKDCESAVSKLRRTQEARIFDPDQPEKYSLSMLSDLAGVRVLVFPPRRINEVDLVLRPVFNWEADPVTEEGEVLVYKYRGYSKANKKIKGEYQIMSILIGHFFEVEHSAIYKPEPHLHDLTRHTGMMARRTDVLQALKAFEEQFQALLPIGPGA